MALDLGLTTRQVLSTLDAVAGSVRNHSHRLAQSLESCQPFPADAAASRTVASSHSFPTAAPFHLGLGAFHRGVGAALPTTPDPRGAVLESRARLSFLTTLCRPSFPGP